MRKTPDSELLEITIDLVETCPGCGQDGVLKVNVLSGYDTAKPSHRWCSGYGCTYSKDLLGG